MSDQNEDKKWINKVGVIAEAKPKPDGSKGLPYVLIDQDIVLKKGDRLVMKKKSDALNEAFESGRITEAKYNELVKTQSWIKYELARAPRGEKQ